MAAIELVCRQHVEAGGEGSTVIIVDGLWAYCAGAATDGHDWERVPPTDVKKIELARSARRRSEI